MWHRSILGLALFTLSVALQGGVPRPDARQPTPRLVHPDIVLILTDDQTMESVARMPYVSSGTAWITFRNAFVGNALCCPSRATILQGRYDTHTRVTNNAQAADLDETETVAVWLQRAGYLTGLFGKYLNDYPFGRGNYIPPGWDDWQAAYGNTLYRQYGWDLNANGVSEHHGYQPADYEVDVLTQRVTDFIAASAAAGRPFFAYFAPTATHGPWRASPTWTGRYAAAPVALDPSFNEADVSDKPAWVQALAPADPAQVEAERRREWEAAGSVDDAVQRIDAALTTAGVIDSTVEIFMTDNGYSFGNHRWEAKRCEYDECSHTPLLVRYPGRAARTDSHLIGNVDLAPTISALAGATPGLPQDGRSFAPLLTGGRLRTPRSGLLLHWSGGDNNGLADQPDSLPQFWGVRTRTWKYVEIDTGERELYDEQADPYELTNLADQSAYQQQQEALKAQLAALKAAADAPREPLRTDLPGPGPMPPDTG